jgi:hypothetical protein
LKKNKFILIYFEIYEFYFRICFLKIDYLTISLNLKLRNGESISALKTRCMREPLVVSQQDRGGAEETISQTLLFGIFLGGAAEL